MSTSGIYGGACRAEARLEPKRTFVKLKAGVKASIGEVLVVVAGYGLYPAAANAATGKLAGVVVVPGDNTSGADGDVTVVCEDGVIDFLNDGTHPCAQADVMAGVFLSDKQTISKDSGDGPPAGPLKEFNSASALPGRPCRVSLAVAG